MTITKIIKGPQANRKDHLDINEQASKDIPRPVSAG